MELNDIKMFYEVAQTNSVSQAAQNLGYTQSNISKRIKRLEEELDQRLFERNNKGMHLTSAGQEFIPYAQKLITAYLEIEEHFLKLPLNTLLGATQTIAHSYLEKLFADPAYTIFTAPISTLTTRLLAGTLDFILINQPLTDPAVKLIQTWEEALCFTQSQTADGLFHERTFIVNREPTCPYRKATLEYITQYPNAQILEVDTLDMILRMIKHENMTALLPISLIEEIPDIQPITSRTCTFTATIYVYALQQTKKQFQLP